MLPALGALTVSSDGVLTVIGTTSGSVPATKMVLGGMAVSQTGRLYVVFV